MADKKLRVGIIGTGGISNAHTQKYLMMDDVEIVAGANIVSKHTKARRQGEASQIVKTEGAIYACKVQLVCNNSKCEKYGQGVRVQYKVVEGKKVRVCAKCGAEI